MEKPKDWLKGKEFESIVLDRLNEYRKEKIASIGRYGVQAAVRFVDGQKDVVLQKSLPDFEGTVRGGRQTIFDTKVCSDSSWRLDSFRDKPKSDKRQLEHMLERSEYGVPCFFLLHWNPRVLKTRVDFAETYAIPVHPSHVIWREFYSLERKSLTRDDCQEYGFHVPWTVRGRGRVYRPDVLLAIRLVAGCVLGLCRESAGRFI